MELLFSKIFLEAYKMSVEASGFRNMNIENGLTEENINEVEKTLQSFIYDILGFRFNGAYNWGEVRIYFDNICKNIDRNGNKPLVDLINNYKKDYLKLLEEHPHVRMLTEVVKKIFSREYDGKLGNDSIESYQSNNAETILRHNKAANSLIIAKAERQTTTPLPSVIISNLDHIEKVLSKFVRVVKESDTYYNVFKIEGYDNYTDEEKIKMLFEGILLNATAYDLANVDLFFGRYTEFITDEKLSSIKGVNYLGEAFDDQMYFMVKRSDCEYETPYYMSFMLLNKKFELPNIRVGISEDRHKAYIAAVQTSQMTGRNAEIDQMVKDNVPRTSSFNFSNPTHMSSIIIALGILKGMGVNIVDVVDYMPIRYYKTIKDKSMGEEEANRYLTRLTDQNFNTYFKLEELTEGIEITSHAGTGHNMTLEVMDEVICHNEFFQNLYDLGYNFGLTIDIPNRSSRNN